MNIIKYTVGIDISSRTLDFCLFEKGKALEHWCIENNKKAIRKLLKNLFKLGVQTNNTWFCAEHTGLFGVRLQQCLEELDLNYSMVPAIEITNSIGLVRGKSDKIDSKRIAEYAFRFQDKLRPTKLPPAYLMRIARLFTFRKQRVKRTTALKNQIKQLEGAWQCAPRDYMLKTAKKELMEAKKVIKEVERQLTDLIMNSEAKTNYSLSKSVLGTGPIIACYLLICTENYKLFSDARKFASYAGIAPFEHSSGSSIRGKTRTSIHRNEQIKTLILNGVNAMIGRDNEYGTYYRRKIAEGKHKKVVKNAVANKMISRVFAAIKRQTPYVAVYAEKF